MKLLKIEKIDQVKEYWDLEVEDNHNFYANDILIHNSCSMVSANDKEIWFQSKGNILSLQKDNMGFCAFCTSRADVFRDLITHVSEALDISLEDNTITIFGEWAGKGIQKGVGISEIEKSLFIFGCKVTPNDAEVQLVNVAKDQVFKYKNKEYTTKEWNSDIMMVDISCDPKIKNVIGHNEKCVFSKPSTIVTVKQESYWVPSYFLKSPENRIYNIEDYKTYELEIDFNHPEKANNKFLEIIKEVEDECPVAKEFGISGIGEGVVWVVMYKNVPLRFKTKGEKHSKSKVKTVKPVDLEKLSRIEKCTEEITHEWRFVQALTEIFGPDYEKCIDRKRMGEYMKWVSKDLVKEEYDIIEKYGFEPKEVLPTAMKKAKTFFFAVEQL